MNVYENRIIAGVINPIRKVSDTKRFHLNSAFRENYFASSPTDFVYVFPYDIKNVVSIRLETLITPNCWYLISDKQENNSLQIQTFDGSTLTSHSIIIPDGNYDASAVAVYLNSTYLHLSGTSTDLQYLRASFIAVNGKFQFDIVGSPPVGFYYNLQFTDSTASPTSNMMESLGWLLGFRIAEYTSITGAIRGEALFNSGNERYAYFCLDDFNHSVNESQVVCFDGSILGNNVLAKIYTTGDRFIIDDTYGDAGADYGSKTRTRTYYGTTNIRRIRVRILDKFGEPVDFNNMDFSFTLAFDIVYDSGNSRRD